jgi:hypothetical protein
MFGRSYEFLLSGGGGGGGGGAGAGAQRHSSSSGVWSVGEDAAPSALRSGVGPPVPAPA